MFQPDFNFQEENQQIPSFNQMNLMEHLQQIPDFRRKQGLMVVLLLTIMSIMSGRCKYREIAAFGKANQKELLKFFHLEKRNCLPSHVTIREVMKWIDFDDVLTAFNDWAKHEDNEWMSIDGKAQLQTVRQHIKISFH